MPGTKRAHAETTSSSSAPSSSSSTAEETTKPEPEQLVLLLAPEDGQPELPLFALLTPTQFKRIEEFQPSLSIETMFGTNGDYYDWHGVRRRVCTPEETKTVLEIFKISHDEMREFTSLLLDGFENWVSSSLGTRLDAKK